MIEVTKLIKKKLKKKIEEKLKNMTIFLVPVIIP